MPSGDRPLVGIALERELFERGAAVLRAEAPPEGGVADALIAAGILVLAPGRAPLSLPEDDKAAADAILHYLEEAGVVLAPDSLMEGEGI